MANTFQRIWTTTLGTKLWLAVAGLLTLVGLLVQLLPESTAPIIRLFGYVLILFGALLVLDALVIVPLKRVRNGLCHIAKGDFDYRVLPNLSACLEPLAVDFNRAVDALQHHVRHIEQQNWEHATLYKALSSLLVSQDIVQVAHSVAAALVEHFNYVDCGVMILDEETGDITRLGRAGEFNVSSQVKLTLNGRGLVSECLRSRQMIYVPNVAQDDRYLANHARTRSELVVPLLSNGTAFGVLDLQSPNVDGFSERDRRIVSEFATHAAFMLDNARLYQLLNRYNTELEQRVSARTAELELAIDRERRLNELKTRFTSMVSHELRNPLTVIKASNDLLMRYADRLPSEKVQQHHQVIDTQISQLTQLLEDVMLIQRSSAVGLEFNPKPTDIAELVNGIVREYRITIDGTRTLRFQTEYDRPTTIRVDPKLIRLMLNNLLSNAIKYSLKDSTITFNVQVSNNALTFIVADEGIGIPQEELPKVFETYHRASNVGTITGTGVGLSVVRRAVEAHKGTIDVKSVLNQGTIFTVTLPIADD